MYIRPIWIKNDTDSADVRWTDNTYLADRFPFYKTKIVHVVFTQWALEFYVWNTVAKRRTCLLNNPKFRLPYGNRHTIFWPRFFWYRCGKVLSIRLCTKNIEILTFVFRVLSSETGHSPHCAAVKDESPCIGSPNILQCVSGLNCCLTSIS
jgi:hypothetical protein